LQVPESVSTEFVFELVEQMRNMILHLVGRCLEGSLETEVDRILDRQAAHLYRREFMRSAARIWQAPDEAEARLIDVAFCQARHIRQAKAIRTLARDFEDTYTGRLGQGRGSCVRTSTAAPSAGRLRRCIHALLP